MKLFSVGYQLIEHSDERFSDIVSEYRDSIREVYFAWPGQASGRAPLPTEATDYMLSELRQIKSMGISLDLLFNASCYGKDAFSRSFASRIESIVSNISDAVGLDAITTMSPLVAETVKNKIPDIDVRASVNMRIGTVRAMQYVSDFFDSYNVQREFNRDLDRLGELQKWADGNGKRLHVLANSGCLNFCTFQTFHDNAVSHESEIEESADSIQIPTLCRKCYSQRDQWVNFLQGSWIRPEDIAKHRLHFHGGYKLATRMHDNPRMVIHAYAQGKFYGNLPDLMEPGHGHLFNPYVIDNTKFPDEWFERTVLCGQKCADCKFCMETLAKVMVELPGE